MKTGRFGCVALLMSSHPGRGCIPEDMMWGILDELEEHGQHLMLVRVPDEPLDNESVMPRLLCEWMVDGIFVGLNYQDAAPPGMVEIIRQHHIPAIWINAYRDWDCARPNDDHGGYAATQHLLDLGHRHIAYASTTNKEHYSSLHRQRGYELAMSEAGLMPHVFEFDPLASRQQQLETTSSWLTSGKRPTAIIFYDQSNALLALHAAEQIGIRVPADLSLLVIASNRVVSLLKSFDTFVIPFRQLGRMAARQLMQKIESPQTLLPPCILPLVHVAGETCAVAPIPIEMEDPHG
jgi:LacI family transcriptional regulator